MEQNTPPETQKMPVGYPVDISVPYPERSSRMLALAALIFMIPKTIMILPHIVCLYILGFLSFVAFFIAQIAVLITGKYPRALFDFVVGIRRWQTRVGAYMLGLTDSYPPFRMK